ncbi:MAG TPA: hypothetical protein VHM70_11790 [Polyangiaceae bacterium]|jgi:hypothetical protein|nr:hypothetical protein [Polyangiaceae bacterium]
MHEPESENWADYWQQQPLLGYVETNDDVATETDKNRRVVVLDVIPETKALQFLNAGYRFAALEEQPSLLPTAQIAFEIDHDELGEGTWHRIELGPSGTFVAELYRDLDVLPPAITNLMLKGPVADDVAVDLKKLFTLDRLPDASDQELADALGEPQAAVFCVYDVGQGNANALCAADGRPLVYFDFGGGCLWNARTYPPKRSPPVSLQFCPRPSIILSHWDFDHWFSGTKQALGPSTKWIAPNQSFGARTAKFAASLTATGSLLKWAGTSFSTGDLTLVRCNGKSKNDSGIAIFVTLDGELIVSPADAEFNCVPIPAHCHRPHLGLVATHHGSSHIGNPIPRPLVESTLAYSFGVGNKYGHAKAKARTNYAHEGWTYALETDGGHIAIPVLPTVLPCGGRCTLQASQS